MDMRIPLCRLKIMFESNSLKSTILVGRLGVRPSRAVLGSSGLPSRGLRLLGADLVDPASSHMLYLKDQAMHVSVQDFVRQNCECLRAPASPAPSARGGPVHGQERLLPIRQDPELRGPRYTGDLDVIEAAMRTRPGSPTLRRAGAPDIRSHSAPLRNTTK